MNWIGGNFQRHSKSNSNRIQKAQKRHFAQSRLHSQGRLDDRKPFQSSLFESQGVGKTDVLRSGNLRALAERGLEECDIEHRHKGPSLEHRKSPPRVDQTWPHLFKENLTANQRYLVEEHKPVGVNRQTARTAALEARKKELLRQTDWSNIKVAKPLHIEFDPPRELQRIARRPKAASNTGKLKLLGGKAMGKQGGQLDLGSMLSEQVSHEKHKNDTNSSSWIINDPQITTWSASIYSPEHVEPERDVSAELYPRFKSSDTEESQELPPMPQSTPMRNFMTNSYANYATQASKSMPLRRPGRFNAKYEFPWISKARPLASFESASSIATTIRPHSNERVHGPHFQGNDDDRLDKKAPTIELNHPAAIVKNPPLPRVNCEQNRLSPIHFTPSSFESSASNITGTVDSDIWIRQVLADDISQIENDFEFLPTPSRGKLCKDSHLKSKREDFDHQRANLIARSGNVRRHDNGMDIPTTGSTLYLSPSCASVFYSHPRNGSQAPLHSKSEYFTRPEPTRDVMSEHFHDIHRYSDTVSSRTEFSSLRTTASKYMYLQTCAPSLSMPGACYLKRKFNSSLSDGENLELHDVPQASQQQASAPVCAINTLSSPQLRYSSRLERQKFPRLHTTARRWHPQHRSLVPPSPSMEFQFGRVLANGRGSCPFFDTSTSWTSSHPIETAVARSSTPFQPHYPFPNAECKNGLQDHSLESRPSDIQEIDPLYPMLLSTDRADEFGFH